MRFVLRLLQMCPLRRSVSYVISEKKVTIVIFLRYFHTWWLYSCKKQKTLQLLVITNNTRNKQTIREKDI